MIITTETDNDKINKNINIINKNLNANIPALANTVETVVKICNKIVAAISKRDNDPNFSKKIQLGILMNSIYFKQWKL